MDAIEQPLVALVFTWVAGLAKPYFTQNMDALLVAGGRDLVAKMTPGSQAAKICGWAIDAMAAAWGV